MKTDTNLNTNSNSNTNTNTTLKKDLYLSWSDTLKTLVILAAATLLSLGLGVFDIRGQNAIMIYILSVLVISRITIGYIYGILASAVSVLLFNFFFTAPHFTFSAIQSGYPITFAVMLVIALITSTLTVRIKAQVKLAQEKEQRTETLYEINKKLLKTRGLENIVALTNRYIVKLFGRSVIFYMADPEPGSTALKGIIAQNDSEDTAFLESEKERAVVHWVFMNHKHAGVGTDVLMEAQAFYLPISSQDKVLGVIGLSCVEGELSSNNRAFLKMITSQIAMALERQYLSDEQRRILLETEKEKMRSDLLRAISHDLRTPLTSILGASSAILENSDRLDREAQDQLLTNIKEDSQWLIRMVENLLSVTRIREGTMNVTKSPEAAEEIIAAAISSTRKRFPSSNIIVKVPDTLLLVPMDGILIEQVLLNLLENAIKHSRKGSNIKVEVKKRGNHAVFEVIDNGVGIAEQDFPYLFQSDFPNEKCSADSSRGMGIGLSICKAIIKAHQGRIEAVNHQEDGAVFRFTLPLEGSTTHE